MAHTCPSCHTLVAQSNLTQCPRCGAQLFPDKDRSQAEKTEVLSPATGTTDKTFVYDYQEGELPAKANANTIQHASDADSPADISRDGEPVHQAPAKGLAKTLAEPGSPPKSKGQDGELAPGEIVNQKYKIVSVLGKGGLGVVYKVEHLLLPSKKFFALKLLHPNLSQNELFRKRFIREVEVAMEFAHEHAVQIRDFGETASGEQYFTMDFSPGIPLRKIMDTVGVMPEARALRITRQVLSALQNAHAKGIVHRDLKPENILIEERFGKDHTLVLDFGIAKVLNDAPDNKLTGGGVIGTPLYMSPEQASGEEVDKRTDIYALGVILYEMVTGKPPFSGSTRQILLAHITNKPRTPREVKSSVSPQVEAIITKAMSKERGARFASAEELIDAIDAIGGLQDGKRSQASGLKSKILWSTVSVLALLVLGGLGFFYMQENARCVNILSRGEESLAAGNFNGAERLLKEMDTLWFHRNKKNVLARRLDTVRDEHWHALMLQGKEKIGACDYAAAAAIFDQADHVKKTPALTKALTLACLSMTQGRWAECVENLKEFQSHAPEEIPPGVRDFLSATVSRSEKELTRQSLLVRGKEALAADNFEEALRSFKDASDIRPDGDTELLLRRCEKEKEWQSLMRQGLEKITQEKFDQAQPFFAQADVIKKDSAHKEILGIKNLLEGMALLQKKDWLQALAALTSARNSFPNIKISVLDKAARQCEEVLLRQRQEEGRRDEVKGLGLALKKSLAEKEWAAIPSLLEQLQQKSRLPEEKTQLKSFQSQFPPIRFELFASPNPRNTPLQKVTGKLGAGYFYQIELEVLQEVYVYGFDQDDTANIEPIFPACKLKGAFKPFANPVRPGKYNIPPGKSAFRLNDTERQELFYFVYSNFPLINPAQMVEDHLTGRNKCPTLIIKVFDKTVKK